MARGTLRIYLGAAPGVGKTYAMLDEGCRRSEPRDRRRRRARRDPRPRATARADRRPRGRPAASARIPRHDARGDGRRRGPARAGPQVALVDELAHTNVPGSRNEKRWQDVDELLDAGIDVISTLNIQHLESLNDVVERITGIAQRETMPDEVVRRADQIELVDMTPEALRRRMAHGNVYPAERIDAALGNYFRAGNLGALRELALLWVADRVDEALDEYRRRHGIDRPWETRERVLVALTGAADGDRLVRRAARMASARRATSSACTSRPQDGLAATARDALAQPARARGALGGTYREVVGDDVGKALVDAARARERDADRARRHPPLALARSSPRARSSDA